MTLIVLNKGDTYEKNSKEHNRASGKHTAS